MTRTISAASLLVASLSLSGCDPGRPVTANLTPSTLDACGVPTNPDPGILVSTVGEPGGEPGDSAYEGPAVVERSTAQGLTLAFTQPNAARVNLASPADADPLPRHVNIGGLGSAPLFPRGAKLWIAKNPAGDFEAPRGPGWTPSPASLSVYDQKGGRLLFAVSSNGGVGPLPSTRGASSCTTSSFGDCGHDQLTHESVLVHGDSDVEIPDAQGRLVRLGGQDYDVASRSLSDVVTDNGRCVYAGSDATTYRYSKMDIKARDLPALVGGLEAGAPPACARGNDEQKGVYFSIYDFADNTFYDGPAIYRGKSVRLEDRNECFSFDAPGAAAEGHGPPDLEVCGSPGLFAAPPIGSELWVTRVPFGFATLRTAEHGTLLLANVSSSVGFADVAKNLGAALGVKVRAQQGCAYAHDFAGQPTYFLTDLVVETTPPVVVTGDARTVITLDGKEFNVWMAWDSGWLTVAPR
jgi:hypothetical protein